MGLFESCHQTFLTFAGETYEQIKETPMGSPVSGLVAELVPQVFENIVFIQNEPVFWRRYVDDTSVTVKKNMLQHFNELLNAVLSDIKFTREEEQEQRLSFLDVLVRRNLNEDGDEDETIASCAVLRQENAAVVTNAYAVQTGFPLPGKITTELLSTTGTEGYHRTPRLHQETYLTVLTSTECNDQWPSTNRP
nr:unnamed protein product [Spirometra erinaceieuropaei]